MVKSPQPIKLGTRLKGRKFYSVSLKSSGKDLTIEVEFVYLKCLRDCLSYHPTWFLQF